MESPIDINAILGPRASLTVTADENDADRRARLAADARWDRLALVKHYVLFFATLFSICGLATLCVYYLVVDPTATADTKRWAQTVLSSVLTGSVGFVLGQLTGPRK